MFFNTKALDSEPHLLLTILKTIPLVFRSRMYLLYIFCKFIHNIIFHYAEDAKICDVYHKMALDAFAGNRSDSVADSVRRCFNAWFDGPIQLSNGKYLHHGTPEFDNLIRI